MEYRDKVLEIVQKNGPLLPVDVYKHIGLNVLMTSAVLGELVSGEKLKLTFLKIGGSPLYYAPGQEQKLEQYSSRLKGPEKEAFELLKKNKILVDKDLAPVIRVAIKDIKDYAKQVKYKEDYFWKWYLLSDEEAEIEVRKKIGEIKEVEKPKVQEKIREKVEEKQQTITQKEETNNKQTESEEELEIFTQYKAKSVKTPVKEKVVQDEIKEPQKEDKIEKPIEQERLVQTNTTTTTIEKKERAPKKEKKVADLTDKFFDQVKAYFELNKIEIIDCVIVKKNSEMDLVIKMTSPMGKITYYCKAKNKKRINDGDLSSAYVKGELKKLPVIFLTTGELTKKTQELLLTDFKNITLTKI